MNNVIIKQNKRKEVQLIILSIIMLIVSIYVLTMSIIYGEALYIILGVIGTVFFGVSFSFIVKTVICKIPLLLIGDDGITDMSTAFSVGFIAWGEIQSINVKRAYMQKYIVVTVYDSTEISKRISFFKRVTMKANTIFHSPPVLILLGIADIEFNETVALMQKRLEDCGTA
ncbi:MAG: hypothetical protein MUO60_07315 [Clostridiaceae bacterium]|nr:hypothetical protein [Clostridiaceae bacterium]